MVYTLIEQEFIMGYYQSAEYTVDCNEERLIEALGAEVLIAELAKYFSLDDWADALNSIASEWGVELHD